MDVPIFRKSESKILLGLDRIRDVLKFFGDPQEKFESAVVSGTVGKGQLCFHTAQILSQHMDVGIYTSPHLVSFNERIGVFRKGELKLVSDDEIKILSRDVQTAEERKKVELTFFEHATCMAFLWFFELKIPFAVLEVGLGGRLDAVSVARSRWSALTKIDIDHENFLGTTRESIACEKVRCSPPSAKRVMLFGKDDPVFGAISDWVKGPFVLSDDIHLEEVSRSDEFFGPFDFLLTWRYSGGTENRSEHTLRVEYSGAYSLFENAVGASVLADIIARDILAFGLEKMKLDAKQWRGRIEVFGNVIYDCAHNVAGIKMLVDFLKRFFRSKKLRVVFAVMKDKRWREMVKILDEVADEFIFTHFDSPRCLDPEKIEEFVRTNLAKRCAVMPPEKAVGYAFENSPAVITGTTYLYRFFEQRKAEMRNTKT